ncbi:hypothetical protein [Bradyrhizobium guangxiense]|uniref:hypothetical protein n=1 Tax=Bradyrhizobium guangxiense TaxID=1325115 RepID=UPI0010086DE6|nr:hypothetical protein [Bradyrhizobium guangxiense]
MPDLRLEGTIILENDKTYWFKDNFKGQEVSLTRAMAIVESIVDRKLVPFETKLFLARPFDGSKVIAIVSLLVASPSQTNPLTAVGRAVVGYIVRHRENRARFNYGDVIGTDAFYTTQGKLVGEITVTRKDEPGLETPLIDPIDLVGGELAGLVRIGAKALIRAGADVAASTFRDAMALVERKLVERGARSEAAAIRVLTEEELAKVWGAGRGAKPLTPREVDKAIGIMRGGTDVHVESLGQMRQLQGELGQLGVRSQSTSAIIPQRPAGTELTQELQGSFKGGRGTYRVDDAHGPGQVPYSPHNEYPHINITLPDGRKLAILVNGSKSF